MAIDDIFPVVIARDAAATIELTLASLREFPEIIVYDYGSPDATREICAAYSNVQLVVGDFLGCGRTRNHAASLAEGDWILAIEPGEFLSDGLLASLRALELSSRDEVFALNRHNLFMGKDMRWGGWGQEWLARLYERHRYQFGDALVDERLVLAPDTRVTPIKGPLWHESVPGLDAILIDIGRRTRLRGHLPGEPIAVPSATLRALGAFGQSYVLKLGVLEGWRGLVIAAAAGIETFFRLMQRYVNASQSSPARHRPRAIR